MNLALAYKRAINFQALIQLSLLFINTSSTSWIINFEDQETNTKNSTAIERNTSLKDLITFVESLKAENSIDIHSLELVTESRIQDLGKSEMVDTIKQSHLTVCKNVLFLNCHLISKLIFSSTIYIDFVSNQDPLEPF